MGAEISLFYLFVSIESSTLNEGKVKVHVFDTPQVVNCFKVESDAALLPS